jgi:hypothetical protein
VDAFVYADKTEIFDDEFGLPRSIDLFTSRALYEKTVRDGRVPQKATAEALKFHYEVVQSTNFSGWTLPVKFAYTSYTEGADGKWRPIVGGAGAVTTIREGSRPVFPAAAPNNSVVTRPTDVTTTVALDETRSMKKRPLRLPILVPLVIAALLLGFWVAIAKKKGR